MSLWRKVTRGLRDLRNRAAADREIADEVQHYLEQATAEHLARGLSPDAARRAALFELGSAASVREQVREYGWENVVASTLADARYAVRRLREAPGFTAVAVLTLALGIGATTAIFSAVKPILLEPLPYPNADRLAMIWDFGRDGSRLEVTFGTYRELVERARSFEAFAVLKPWQPTLSGEARPERLEGQQVSARYFQVLGVAPALGRALQESDDVPNGPRVVVLSDGLWRRRFGADPSVVGRQITLDEVGHTVVGVMPAGFEDVLAPAAEVWTALQYDMSQDRAWGHHLRMVGRLRRGVAWDVGKRELDGIAREPVPEFPRVEWAKLEDGLRVDPLKAEVTGQARPALLAILGAVALVLLTAVMNVTNLLLAHGARRRGEFALRAALGAGPTRLIRQLLVESVILALAGGAAGLGVALAGARALVALSPAALPRASAIGIDGGVFVFALAVTTLVGAACGVVPALVAGRSAPQRALQQETRRAAVGHRRTRSALVVVEVALALVLLVGSGLLLRSMERLFAVDPGFEPAGLLTMQVHATGGRFDDAATTKRFFAEALDAVRAVPGVEAAALTSTLPLSGDLEPVRAAGASYGVHFEQNPPEPGMDRTAFRYSVSPGYFEAMGIPLRRGRFLTERDRADAPYVAVISESMARRRLPGLDPIGHRLRIGGNEPLYTVVGVVGDVRQVSLALGESDAVYTTPDQWQYADNVMSLLVRARGDAAALAAAVREAVWSVDPDRPVVRVATMDRLVALSAAERRFALILFEAFALAALLLAAIGMYGVLAGGVAERTHEIGVRTALGASRANLLGLIVRQGMGLTALGVAIGLAGAVAASRAFAAMLFGVSPLDPMTYAAVVALLAAVSLIASIVPAWRAARIDPATTLRQ